MVELENGCVCCTVRGDLLKTVKEFALELDDEAEDVEADGNAAKKKYKYDALVIESTGIAEPLGVAQTFVMDENGNCGEAGHDFEQEEEQDGDEEDGEQDDDVEMVWRSLDFFFLCSSSPSMVSVT